MLKAVVARLRALIGGRMDRQHVLLALGDRLEALKARLQENEIARAVRKAAMNQETVLKIEGDAELNRKMHRLGVPLRDDQGVARNTEDIITEAQRAESKRGFDEARAKGRMVFTAREQGNVRVTASGAVYMAEPGKDGKTGPWRRVKGKAAVEVKKSLGVAEARGVAA